MPVSWQTRFRSSSATVTFFRIVWRTRWPGTDVSVSAASASASRRSCGMSLSAQTYRCAAASSTTFWRSVATAKSAPRFLGGGLARAAAEDAALEQRVAHHAVAPVGAAGDLAAREEALDGRLAVLVDDEPAVLVVEDGIGEDRLG